MDPGAVAALVGSSVWGGFSLWRMHRLSWRRYLRKTRRYSIAEFPDGQPGRIVGHAAPLERELSSALFDQPCVYYSCVALRDLTNGVGLTKGPHWQTLVIETSSEPFAIFDESGRAIVEPRNGQLVGFEARHVYGTLANPTGRQLDFMKRYRLPRGPNIAIIETVIRSGERLAILGGGRREPDPDAPPDGYRNGRPTRLHLAYSKSYRLAFCDSPDTMK